MEEILWANAGCSKIHNTNNNNNDQQTDNNKKHHNHSLSMLDNRTNNSTNNSTNSSTNKNIYSTHHNRDSQIQ